MGIVLFRLDERLIHGQVVVAWGSILRPNRLVIFNDQVAASPWERELYLCCVPPEYQASVFGLQEASQRLSNGAFDKERVIALVDKLPDVLELRSNGAPVSEVNVGGMHYSPHRTKLLPYVYLSKEERQICEELFCLGVNLYCQDVPTAERIDLKKLLKILS
jgi:mannose/fructose/N-acetylgalactosamine-specific phosphotransferase system component IIB